ncbi:hypothetical protein HDU96_010238 [Phlyctochytrium bullatum]|nr:hypothetical protein HDU96_010238 [Phlyctochytrium bullatum]
MATIGERLAAVEAEIVAMKARVEASKAIVYSQRELVSVQFQAWKTAIAQEEGPESIQHYKEMLDRQFEISKPLEEEYIGLQHQLVALRNKDNLLLGERLTIRRVLALEAGLLARAAAKAKAAAEKNASASSTKKKRFARSPDLRRKVLRKLMVAEARRRNGGSLPEIAPLTTEELDST